MSYPGHAGRPGKVGGSIKSKDKNDVSKGNINDIKELRNILEKSDANLYVRWSNSKERDFTKNVVSRDYVSGELHTGLSAVPLEKNSYDDYLASQIHEYGFLRMKGDLRPHIYEAERSGTDSDGYALIRPTKYIGTLSDSFIKQLDDKKYHENLQKNSEMQSLQKYMDENPKGINSAMMERFNRLKKEVKPY